LCQSYCPNKNQTFEPFLCMRYDCIYSQYEKIERAAEKRKQALSSDNEIVKKYGREVATRWYDMGRKKIRICQRRWITTDSEGQCRYYEI
jgi:hypothetical protein